MKSTTKARIEKSLTRLGVDVACFQQEIEFFGKKLDLLNKTGRYAGLLRRIRVWGDFANFAADVFEVHFAYMFESAGKPLEREVKLIPNSGKSVDFVYKNSNVQLNMELCHFMEGEWIREEQQKDNWQVCLSNAQTDEKRTEKEQLIRLQRKIRGKCTDENNHPIKFPSPSDRQINIIVANISEPLLGMVDEYDCIEIVLGSPYVPRELGHGILGLASRLSPDAPKEFVDAYDKNRYLRERIHGVLFARDVRKSKRYIDSHYKFLFVPNLQLMMEHQYSELRSHFPERLKIFQPKTSGRYSLRHPCINHEV